MKKILLLVWILLLLLSCENNKSKPVYYDLEEDTEEASYAQSGDEIAVPFYEENGVKYIRVTVNGMGVDMILDTGCSGALISVAEANYLYQKGRLSFDDVLGVAQSQIADGSIVENMVVNLREVIIGDKIICPNVQATVSNNISAPLLLGNGVLDRAASFTIDNENKVIIFKVL